MRFGMSVNMDVPDAARLAKRTLECLKGYEVLLETEVANRLHMTGMRLEEMDVDVMITVGGDGTILRALHHNTAPIFGVNAGDLGFLTTVTEEELEEGIDNILNGHYSLDVRSKLKTTLSGVRLSDAVNEAVVHTANIAKIRHFQVHVDGEMAINVRADGIIIATPTGSTCYAMSVGAPLLDPRVSGLIIAPMAPFKFAARPMVVPSGSKISLHLVRPKECVVVIDGQESIPMAGNEMIEFGASDTEARFVTFGKGFYTRTREKLMGSIC
jgi:NAD+ kinase